MLADVLRSAIALLIGYAQVFRAGHRRPLRPVALLVFLARSAPARIVAADLLARIDATLLDVHHLGLLGAGAVLHHATRRGGDRHRTLGRSAAARIGDPSPTGGRARRPAWAARRRRRRLSAVRGVDRRHLDVVDQPRVVLPDAVHQIAEQLEGL